MSGSAPRLNPVSPGPSLARQFATMLLLLISLAISLTFLFVQTPAPPLQQHSTLVLVWSGMRPDMVTTNLTPNLLALGDRGVMADDHHSAPIMPPQAPASASNAAQLTPTVTPTLTPTLTPIPSPSPTPPPVVIAPGGVPVLPVVAQAALSKGLSVSYEGDGAADLAQAASGQTRAFLLDDQIAYPANLPQQLQAAQITLPGTPTPPDRDHASASQMGAALTQAFVRVILPAEHAANGAFFSVIVYCDPAQTAADTGIGSLALLDAIRSDDQDLGAIEDGLRQANLQDSVNIIVTSDHGLVDVIPPGQSGAGDSRGVAPDTAARTDIAALLQAGAARGAQGDLPDVGAQGVTRGTLTDATTTQVAAGGGMDSLTIPATPAIRAVGQGDVVAGQKKLARELIAWLQRQAEVGPIFLNDQLGNLGGTLPLSDITDVNASSPAIVFSFVALPHDIGQAATNSLRFSGSAYGDTDALATWGALSRRDLHTLLYAAGPSFKSGGVRDLAPTSTADLGPTLARMLSVTLPAGQEGRTINEILSDGDDVANSTTTSYLDSALAVSADGKSTYIETVAIEQFDGNTYIQGAYAVHADASANATTLLTQAHALATQE